MRTRSLLEPAADTSTRSGTRSAFPAERLACSRTVYVARDPAASDRLRQHTDRRDTDAPFARTTETPGASRTHTDIPDAVDPPSREAAFATRTRTEKTLPTRTTFGIAMPTRSTGSPDGDGPGAAVGTTAFDGSDAGLGPAAFVAVTVNV